MIRLLKLAAAALSGLLVYASYEPIGWWWAAIVGIAVLLWLLRSASARFGALLGAAHGMTLYVLLLPWIGEFVGNGPFLALCVYLSVFSIAFGAVAPRVMRLPGGIFAAVLVYVAVEWVRSTMPFGGFAWVRLAWGQVNGPLAHFAPLGGPALVSTLVALIAAMLVWAVGARARARVAAIAGVFLLLGVGVVLPTLNTTADTGSIRVAAIQGNVPRLGLDFNAQRMAVLANHVEATAALDQPVDVVIWPENSADVDPFRNADAQALIQQAVGHAGAPVLVGAVTRDEVGARNQIVAFGADGQVGEHHNKKYLQPFGEWMPWRDFFRNFSSMVDLAGDFQPGTGDGVIHIQAALAQMPVAIGIMTCYEVAFDQAGRDAVAAGAQILATPTNNATFGFSDMTFQQLAMSRMRAMELDRAVVVAATSGVSALVRPDGSVMQRTEIFRQDQLVNTMVLRNTLTPAARWGHTLELVLVMMGAICFILSFLPRRTHTA